MVEDSQSLFAAGNGALKPTFVATKNGALFEQKSHRRFQAFLSWNAISGRAVSLGFFKNWK